MLNFPLNTTNYILQVQISQNSEGVIIVDIDPGFTLPDNSTTLRVEIPMLLEKMDFEFDESAIKIIDTINTSLTPTVKTNVGSFKFDASTSDINVLDTFNASVHTASSARDVVQVRVNFSTSTITVYE